MSMSEAQRAILRASAKDEAAFQQLLSFFSHYESEQAYFNTILNSIHDVVFQTDVDGRWVYLSPAWESVTGFSIQATLGNPSLAYVHRDERFSGIALLRPFSEWKSESASAIIRCKTAQKEVYRTVEVHAQLARNLNGEVVGTAGVLRDISEQVQIELVNNAFVKDMKALQDIHLELSGVRDLDELYYRMIHLSRERLGFDRMALFRLDRTGKHLLGTYGTDPEGNIRDESYYHEDISADHWTNDILHARHHARVWHDNTLTDNQMPIGRGWVGGATLWNGERGLGYIICDNLVSHRPMRPYEGELIALLGSTFGHLIERAEVENARQEQEKRLRLTLEGTRAGTWEWNLQTGERIFNERWAEIIGYSVAELQPFTDETWLSLVHPDDLETSSTLYEAHREGRTDFYECEIRMKHKAGHWVWVVTRGKIMEWTPEGEALRMLGTHMDISARKQGQQRAFELALEREKLDLLATFVQNASHEFRTPLSTITTFASVIAQIDDAHLRAQKAQRVQEQVERLTKLINMLLEMVKLRSDNMLNRERVHLGSLATTLCHQLRSAYGEHPRLVIDIPADLPQVVGDTRYLGAALRHVIENAYRFTPKEGAITVRGDYTHNEVWIEVRDSGLGIEAEAMPHIFKAFWRQDAAHTTPGFGLGLPIAQTIVEQHGGRIFIESEVGKGTTVRIILMAESLQD